MQGSLVRAVFEPAIPGGLAGDYGGASAEATFGVGLGANVLVGGGNGGVTLRPRSVQGQAGISLASGVGAMSLSPLEPQGTSQPLV